VVSDLVAKIIIPDNKKPVDFGFDEMML